MRISVDDLKAQYSRAQRDWPFIADINDQAGLPKCLLHAVGSRETNLCNVVGDGGHGHGVFQLDDRSHQIPAGFDNDVVAQARRAAAMLAGLFAANGSWLAALNAYNSGQTDTRWTANGDYGPDCLDRQALLSIPTGDQMSAEIEQMIRDIHWESTQRLPSRRTDDNALNLPDDTVLGHAIDAASSGWRIEQRLMAMQTTITAQQAAITALTAAVSLDHGLDPDEFKVILNDALANALIHVHVDVAGDPTPGAP